MAAASPSAARFYTWQVPGKPILPHLSYGVMDRIAQEAIRGLGSLPRRGAEVGGVLLGSAQRGDKAVVRIVDCLSVPCRHFFGPSYILTQDEKQALQQLLARWRPSPSRNIYAVGYYRSHTREDLFLSDEDVWLFSTYFADPSRVALLVKPRIASPSVGGFFFWENGKIRSGPSYLEFPFDRQALGGGEPDPEEEEAAAAEVETVPETAAPPEAAAAEPQPAALEPEPAAPVPRPEDAPLPPFIRAAQARRAVGRRPGWKTALLSIPVFMLLVLLGGWLGTQGAGYFNLVLPLGGGAEPYALRLAVTEYGDNLHVTWDRNAPALRETEHGILIIADGDQSRTLELDSGQLRSGSVIYRRSSNPVHFRLELFLKGNRTLSEGWGPPALAEQPADRSPGQ